MPAQHRLGLDDEQRLLPASESTRKEDEEATIDRCKVRSLHLPIEHDELLAEQRVFRNQLRLAPRKVLDAAEDERAGRWLGPSGDPFADCVQSSS